MELKDWHVEHKQECCLSPRGPKLTEVKPLEYAVILCDQTPKLGEPPEQAAFWAFEDDWQAPFEDNFENAEQVLEDDISLSKRPPMSVDPSTLRGLRLTQLDSHLVVVVNSS